MSLLSENIYILRKLKGLQQADMTGVVGIRRSTWSNYENGDSEPDLDTVIKIADYFEVTLDDLLRKKLGTDVHLSQKGKSRIKQAKSTPKSTPNSTPNPSKTGDFNTDLHAQMDVEEGEEVINKPLIEMIRELSEKIDLMQVSLNEVVTKKG